MLEGAQVHTTLPAMDIERPGGRAAWFKDTEGNTIGLIQLRL
jgi:predicted enzyme related to lactoylglutathione lyase